MLSLFLQDLPLYGEEALATGGLSALFAGMSVLITIISIAVYLYSAFAYMTIAKKLKTEPAWLAFIPIANLYLFSKMAKMHWWPILLLIGAIIPFLNILAMIVFSVFVFIWMWKIFERIKRPGWWPLLALIPIVGPIIFLVLLGVAAWGK